MDKNKEIQALLHLIDDPDREVFDSVENRLLSYGAPVIPELENLWENTISDEVQERIEMIIHRIHFADLRQEFVKWAGNGAELLHGALLLAKFMYPDLQTVQTLQELERMRRNLWLEMNSYMTPLEQAKVMESILYNYYKIQGTELNYEKPNDFLLPKLIESKKGNPIATGILYLILSEMLDMPVRAIALPRQFVLGWFSHQTLFEQNVTGNDMSASIKFYIDPASGVPFTQKEIDRYLKRIEADPQPSFFKPLNNLSVLLCLLQQFARCFTHPKDFYKQQELEELRSLLTEFTEGEQPL